MTLFEYLSVAVSIVLSLSAAQILSTLRVVMRADRRYWVHVFWVAFVLYSHLIIWWEFWAFREVSWTLGTFALVLVNPGLLFVASNTLVYSDTAEDGSWEDHFYAVHRSFFPTYGVLILVSVLRDDVLLGASVEFPRLLPEAFMVLICVVGWVSGNRRIHLGLALLSLCAIVASTVFLWLQPGGGSHF